MRESHLLDPNEDTRKALIAVYDNLKLDLNKMCYQSLGSDEEIEDVVRTSLQMHRRDSKLAPIGISAIRSLSYLPKETERNDLLENYLYKMIGKEIELHDAIRPDLFVHTLKMSPEVIRDLPKEDLLKIARYLPEPTRTEVLVEVMEKVCVTEYSSPLEFFTIYYKSLCHYYAAQLSRKERDRFLVENLFAEKPFLELLESGMLLRKNWVILY